METNQFWALIYASVLSIRLHPRNDEGGSPDIREAAVIARAAADFAIKDLN